MTDTKGAAFARMTGLQYQTFASWIQRRRHERGDYQMAATTLKESRRPVPVVRLMEAVLAGPGHPEAEGGPALRVELRCGTRLLASILEEVFADPDQLGIDSFVYLKAKCSVHYQ